MIDALSCLTTEDASDALAIISKVNVLVNSLASSAVVTSITLPFIEMMRDHNNNVH